MYSNSYIQLEVYFLERFLYIFGLIIFVFCLIFLVMNFIGEYDGLVLFGALFGMLNASIAMGVSEILSELKSKKACNK